MTGERERKNAYCATCGHSAMFYSALAVTPVDIFIVEYGTRGRHSPGSRRGALAFVSVFRIANSSQIGNILRHWLHVSDWNTWISCLYCVWLRSGRRQQSTDGQKYISVTLSLSLAFILPTWSLEMLAYCLKLEVTSNKLNKHLLGLINVEIMVSNILSKT